MATVTRTPGAKTWACRFTMPDGRRTMRSTGTRDKKQAVAICQQWQRAADLARKDRLTVDRARRVISDIYNVVAENRMDDQTVEAYMAGWINRKRLEVAESSLVEYKRLARDFVAALGTKAKQTLDAVTPEDIVRYRNDLAEKVSGATVNKNLKALRGAWTQAVKDGLIQRNVFAGVELVKTVNGRRRALTVDELRSLLAIADSEWRGIILAGLYTGQRLGDIVSLRWSAVDLSAGLIHFRTQKTGADLTLPIAAPLMEHLMTIAGHDDPKAYVFPENAGLGQTTVSARFTAMLERVGIITLTDAEKRHLKQDKGQRRESKGVSFHSLRHTATSMLKNADVTDAVAREIIGHKSEAVSRLYTHIESGTLKAALDRMPDVTK